ncbi:MAG: hypothetical protein KME08_15470 [Aphanothece sp. CMT-3BRIN-NPC111]|nr:hypothetical protein [Aphanothece sp. CMT-3BRIN-NPC111]
MLAQQESRRLGHSYIGTEQILLGLLGEGLGVAAQVLNSLGANLTDARIEVEKIIGFGSGVGSNPIIRFIPRSIRSLLAKINSLEPRGGDEAITTLFTPRAKLALEFTAEEASQLGSNFIDTEHLLLGLLRQQENVAVRVLENLGVDLLQVRTEVLRRLNE